MATPISKNVTNLVGTWSLNRKLSDDPDQIFAVQGVPWITRKVLRFANLTLQISQSVSSSDASSEGATDSSSDISSVTTLHIKQTIHPGGFNSETTYPVNGVGQDMSLPIFGDINMLLRYINTAEIKDDVLRQGLEDGCSSNMVIDEAAYNTKMDWTAQVVWGFEMINGKRYFTRNVITSKNSQKNEPVVARMVYDYQC
ncbi:uncharacterized protein N7484_004690 [Penicillium longicatenatum]|uniref:uncharacterized protein n=1 Tax=Penicillium longicatenatum TaxID=1561947 RepID=UPI002547127A|nr:uncharacterized protein N7484_004690 [Penicillium longicatenatum]KAJ5650967.1 hypothetical protein N7484_004690 [Penicillium longicatenatum]